MRTILAKIVLLSVCIGISSVLMAMLFDPETRDERAFAETLIEIANSEEANPNIPSPCTIPRNADDHGFVDRQARLTPYDLRRANLITTSPPWLSNWNSD